MSRADTFHLRWRGRVTGPFAWAEIERKLDAHEIGLLHDLQHNNDWTTLGDYLVLRGEVMRVAPNATAAPPASASDFRTGVPAGKIAWMPQRWIFVALGVLVGFAGAHDFYAHHWIRGAILFVIALLFWRMDWGLIWPWLWAIGEIIYLKIDGRCRPMPWRTPASPGKIDDAAPTKKT